MKRLAWLAMGVGVLVIGMMGILRLITPSDPIRAIDPPASPSELTLPSVHPEMSLPRYLTINSLEISAPIEKVELTAQGDMATPSDERTLGWYGAVPGQPGNAVLAGHTGYPDQPSIFRRFEQLKVGNTLEVGDDKGVRATFEIIQTATYTPDEAPRHTIFGPSTTERLVLITCKGAWQPANKTYSHRLVIYAVRRD